MDIVIFDGYTINPGDLSWSKLEKLCDRLTVFDATPPDKALSRIGNSEILMTSKCRITTAYCFSQLKQGTYLIRLKSPLR